MENNKILDKLGITPNEMQKATFDAILHTDKDVVVLDRKSIRLNSSHVI